MALRYLVDTNVFLEILLNQQKYQSAIAKSYGLTIVTMDNDFKRINQLQKVKFL